MSTVAFTLPVSCQVCLGKVKQPVVCPNLHVFCAACMDMWLQRSQQCPTCRVQISASNPCRQVLGGLNPQVEKGDDFANKELRRCRMELMYKEYEAEIERLEQELTVVKLENQDLKTKLQSVEMKETDKGTPSKQDMTMIASINNKLKDATKLYENIKADMKAVKKENKTLKEDADNVRRENQTLRMELTQRSPRKFGRYTVATLENKVESCEKEIKQLQKALERSDQYIAEMESDVKLYKDRGCPNCNRKSGKGHIDFDDSRYDDSELPSRISRVSENSSDSDEGQVKKSAKYDESFGLEMPSPTTPGTVASSIAAGDHEKDSFLLPKPSPYKEKTVDDAKKKLRFTVPNESSDEYLPKPGTSGIQRDTSLFPSTFQPSIGNNVNGHGLIQAGPSHTASVTGKPGMASANLNISITPEMEDCLRLMDQAEKRRKDGSPPQQVHVRPSVSTSVFPRHGSFGQDNVSSFSRGLITSEGKQTVPVVSGVPSQFGLGSSLPPTGLTTGAASTVGLSASNVGLSASAVGLSAASSGSMFASAPSLVTGFPASQGSMEALNFQSLSQRSHLSQSTEQLKHLAGPPFRP